MPERNGRERGAGSDKVLTAILGSALKAITDEMSTTMEKTTRSPILCEAKDFVTGLYDAEGRMLEQTENLPILSFSLSPVCRHVAEKFRGDVHPGDVFFHNDVFTLGNQNNDVAAFKPIFVGETHVGWAAAKGHMADIGGAVRGGYNPNATEVWQEALRIPAVKVHDRGKLRRDVWDLIFANIRLPIVQEDMRAEIGACTVGERRLQALVAKYGLDAFLAQKERLFEAARRMMEAEIRSIPDGVYRGESTVHFDGKTPGSKYAIRVRITVDGERVTFDYSDTDAQTDGFVNGTYTSSASATVLTFLGMVNPDIPHNHGMVQPLEIVIPEGTILNAAYPAATTFGNHLCPPNADAIIRALAPVIPDRVTAGWNQLLCSLSTGWHPGRRDTYVDILFMGLKGGSGATSTCDGYDHIGMIDASGGVLDQDYEMFEHQTPHLLLEHEYATDSAGAGRWRGGLGVDTRYRVGGERTQIVTFGDGDVEPAFGLFGGGEGTLNRIELRRPDGAVVAPASKEIVPDVPAGTVYGQHAGGGGGYGSPHERPAAKVREEVRDGIVSLEAARDAYGVVLDPATLEILLDETARLRTARGTREGSGPLSQRKGV
jgi:N-methylhydantoinase B